MHPTLNLLVLRCTDIEKTRQFYEQLSLVFREEQHGQGPRHYACEGIGFVLELYPVAVGQLPDQVRLGFSVPSLKAVQGNCPPEVILKQPHTVGDRLVMLLRDPDGRKVELSQPL
jgi:lactoylglutathione lyase